MKRSEKSEGDWKIFPRKDSEDHHRLAITPRSYWDEKSWTMGHMRFNQVDVTERGHLDRYAIGDKMFSVMGNDSDHEG